MSVQTVWPKRAPTNLGSPLSEKKHSGHFPALLSVAAFMQETC